MTPVATSTFLIKSTHPFSPVPSSGYLRRTRFEIDCLPPCDSPRRYALSVPWVIDHLMLLCAPTTCQPMTVQRLTARSLATDAMSLQSVLPLAEEEIGNLKQVYAFLYQRSENTTQQSIGSWLLKRIIEGSRLKVKCM